MLNEERYYYNMRTKANEIITTEERAYLMNSMETLLDDYNYRYQYNALNKIIDYWAVNNEHFINAFKKHPNYVEGKFLIAYVVDIERGMNTNEVKIFKNWIIHILDDCGNTILPTEIIEQIKAEHCSILPDQMFRWIMNMDDIAAQFISAEVATEINEIFPSVHAHKGQKMSRVVNKICTYLNLNTHEEYNRKYAKFADSLSPIVIKRHTVLSVNPLDYLTMSFGNSWASCHTIDKQNKRDMPDSYSGMYSSGTISYMLDGTSMIFYTVSEKYDGTDYWTQDKIDRQMFHYGEEKLIQGRLYPQGNDGDASAYTPYRNIVQAIMAQIFDFPNLWTVKKGTSEISAYRHSYGTHYRDYDNYYTCTISFIKGTDNEESIDIGHDPICIECGCTHDTQDCINCCHSNGSTCASCGCVIDEDGNHLIDGEWYCNDCVSYCDNCNSYVTSETTRVYGHRYATYVCPDCLHEHYRLCVDCDEYYPRDDMHYVSNMDCYVCEGCLDDYYHCEECDELFAEDDVVWIKNDNIYVCQSCCDEHYTLCHKCDEYVENSESYVDDNGNTYCEECWDEMHEDESEKRI